MANPIAHLWSGFGAAVPQHQPLERQCSHLRYVSERLGSPGLVPGDAPGSCKPAFPSSLPFPILPFPVQFPWRQPVGLSLPGCCQPTSFPCCSTLGALLHFSLLSLCALLEDRPVAADEHLAECSHGKFRLGILGRRSFQGNHCAEAETEKSSYM